MRCSDIMNRNVVTCRSKDTAVQCADLMRKHDIGFLPVVDDRGRPVGTITDRDLTTRVLAARKGLDTAIETIMSKQVVSCKADDDLSAAEKKMASQHKSRIVVMDGEHCVGVISLSDIAQREDASKAAALLRDLTKREAKRANP